MMWWYGILYVLNITWKCKSYNYIIIPVHVYSESMNKSCWAHSLSYPQLDVGYREED